MLLSDPLWFPDWKLSSWLQNLFLPRILCSSEALFLVDNLPSTIPPSFFYIPLSTACCTVLSLEPSFLMSASPAQPSSNIRKHGDNLLCLQLSTPWALPLLYIGFCPVEELWVINEVSDAELCFVLFLKINCVCFHWRKTEIILRKIKILIFGCEHQKPQPTIHPFTVGPFLWSFLPCHH